MGFESRAISARVTKQIVTIFSKTCDNLVLTICLKLFKNQSHFIEKGWLKKLKWIVMFQYSLCDMHFGILKNELISGISVRIL